MGRECFKLAIRPIDIYAVILIIAMIFLCQTASADVRFSGFAYNETSLIDNSSSILYGNRSNLHLKAISRSEGAKLVAELDFYTLYGYLAGANETWSRLLRDGQFYIDRLYLKFPISKVDVILGKQRIAWGSGAVFRPTDSFNKPNPLGLSGRKEGVNAVVAKVSIGALSAIDFIVTPPDTFRIVDDKISLTQLKYGKFASRLTFNKFKSDVALSYQYDGDAQNHIFGVDLKGDLKLGYHLETIFVYNIDTFDSDEIEEYWQSVLGVDYSFSGKWILLGEYLYNGPGSNTEMDLQKSDFLFVDHFQYRHYLYSQIQYSHDMFISANIFLLWNMVDKSLITSPGLQYSLFQNSELSLRSQMFFGDESDEFGPERLNSDRIYYLRLTVKF